MEVNKVITKRKGVITTQIDLLQDTAVESDVAQPLNISSMLITFTVLKSDKSSDVTS